MLELIEEEGIGVESANSTPPVTPNSKVNLANPSEADIALARAALLEITPANTVGAFTGAIVESDGVTTIYFDTTLRGYVGWQWTVSIASNTESGSSVLETELTPAEGALLAPDWVPWSERLAEYKLAQAELAAQALEASSHDDDPDDDEEDFDDDEDEGADDFDEESGDFDDEDFDEDDDFDDEDFDDDDFDDEDVNNDDEALLHSGDLDGVDIDD